jgi:hypothetical protein
MLALKTGLPSTALKPFGRPAENIGMSGPARQS